MNGINVQNTLCQSKGFEKQNSIASFQANASLLEIIFLSE